MQKNKNNEISRHRSCMYQPRRKIHPTSNDNKHKISNSGESMCLFSLVDNTHAPGSHAFYDLAAPAVAYVTQLFSALSVFYSSAWSHVFPALFMLPGEQTNILQVA